MTGTIKPWTMQVGEPAPEFELFEIYREMSPRSLSGVAIKGGVSRASVGRMSAERKWLARAAAWDRRQSKNRANATLTRKERMHERHLDLTLKLQDITAIELERWIEQAQRRIADLKASGEHDKDSVTSIEHLSRAVERAVKIERLTEDLHTDHTKSDLDTSLLTDEQLQQFHALLMIARAGK